MPERKGPVPSFKRENTGDIWARLARATRGNNNRQQGKNPQPSIAAIRRKLGG